MQTLFFNPFFRVGSFVVQIAIHDFKAQLRALNVCMRNNFAKFDFWQYNVK